MSMILQSAYVLHRRAYRETSFIVEFFTEEHGRLAAVAKGARKAGSKTASLLQPFRPLLISCFGRGELLGLSQVEADAYPPILSGKNLRCGFYLNELLIRLLPKHDPHGQLFAIYRQALDDLSQTASLVDEKSLRLFEKRLLVEVGYGLPSKDEMRYREECSYYFDVERGFLPYLPPAGKSVTIVAPPLFGGKTLNALIGEQFEDKALLQDIKRLMRLVFTALLGGRPLQSRRLFEAIT